METTLKIGKDDVIAKLKDDGDFDKLRLKTIRKLKDNVSLFLFFTLSFLRFPLSLSLSPLGFPISIFASRFVDFESQKIIKIAPGTVTNDLYELSIVS